MTIDTQARPASATEPKHVNKKLTNSLRAHKRVLASALAGTTIEWYDFYIYGTATALVFGEQFFPAESQFASLIAAFSTLAVGVVIRPLGGIIAGHYGDRVGRKALLIVALLIMGIASFSIGLLPNYQQIGWLAPAALVLLRVLQGLSAGAEWAGAALLAVEHAPARRRGLFGSFTQVGSSAGMLLATGAFFLTQLVTTSEQFQAWGWRIPFLASAVLVAVGLYIRLGVTDGHEFAAAKQSGNVRRFPIIEVLLRHPRAVLITAGLRLGHTGVYYLVTVYLLSYLVNYHGDDSAGVAAVMIASAVGVFTTLFWGWASDRFGRRPVTLFGLACIALSVWFLFFFVEAGAMSLLPLLVIWSINFGNDTVYGPQAAWFAEQFPVEVRYSGVSLGYQLGTVLGGGLLPLIATVLLEIGQGRPWLICAHITLLALLSAVAALAAKDPARRALAN